LLFFSQVPHGWHELGWRDRPSSAPLLRVCECVRVCICVYALVQYGCIVFTTNAFPFHSSLSFLRYLMDGTNPDGDAAPALPLCSECSSFAQKSSLEFTCLFFFMFYRNFSYITSSRVPVSLIVCLRYLMGGTNPDGDAAPALPLCSECSSFAQNSAFPFRYRLVLYLRYLLGGVWALMARGLTRGRAPPSPSTPSV